MKRFALFLALIFTCLAIAGCGDAVEAAGTAVDETLAAATAEPAAEVQDMGEVVVAEDAEFVPVGANAADFDAFKAALGDDAIDEIVLDKDVEITESLTIDKSVTVAEGVTLSIARGAELYVDNGLIDNKGSIVVMGADNADAPNCGVLAIINGGGVSNAGSVALMASTVEAESANALGGQLRLQGGTLENAGTVYFYAGPVGSSGGVGDVSADGAFLNTGLVQVDGNFLRITGRFVNETGGQLVSNATVFVEGGAEFENNGTLTGTGKINDQTVAEYQG